MTIAQRYGFFTVVPGIVLLFIIGVALTSTETDDDEVGDAIVAPAAAELAPESGVRPVPVSVPGVAPDSKPEASAQPTAIPLRNLPKLRSRQISRLRPTSLVRTKSMRNQRSTTWNRHRKRTRK